MADIHEVRRWLWERRAETEVQDSTREQDEPARVLSAKPMFQLVRQIANSRADHTQHRLEEAERTRAIQKTIEQAGIMRELGGPCGGDATAELDCLRQSHPNFAAAIDHLQREAILNGAIGRPITGQRLILVGPPGVGKTDFALSLAHVLALPTPLVIDMACAQHSSDLAGSSTHWSNSAPGRLFEFVAANPVANPLVALDELDKARTDSRTDDPLAPLLHLWEPRTARQWSDQSAPWIELDLSAVNWVATANHLDTIPHPILSRAQVFEVRKPTRAEGAIIIQSAYARLLAERQLDGWLPPHIAPALARQLSELPPRQARRALERAVIEHLSRRPKTCQWH
ncbi:AAA family ATPase [Niveibacterium sp.]|uniref:AAA family ATPase n=1 Tax=Niveibacterium sp. TaxID=2017444 RepID=UPI0035AF63C8